MAKDPKKAEAGRKGGEMTKSLYGEDFFGKIGRMGGKKGGDTTKKRYGRDYYRRIGAKGGAAPHRRRKQTEDV